MFVYIFDFDDSHFITSNSFILIIICLKVSLEDLVEPTPPEVLRVTLDESTPQMIAIGESSVPTTRNIDLATKPRDKAHHIITL